MELKHKNWSDVSIRMYKKIHNILNGNTDDITRDVELLAVLCDVDEDAIWSANIDEISKLKSQIEFTSSIDFPKTFKKKRLMVGKFDCNVVVDLSKYSYGQYVDFKNYFVKDDNIQLLLSTILIPVGHKYCDGYDVADIIDAIEENISIIDANAICFFFLKSYLTSIRRTNRYLLGTMTMKKLMMSKKNENYKTVKNIIENSKTIEHILSSTLSKK